jgi:ribosome biogenesis GTPase
VSRPAPARRDTPAPGGPAADELRRGHVVAAHGRHVVVQADDGTRVRCHTRGKKTEVVVGDTVRWQRSGDEGVVESVEPRRNLLFRQDEWRTKSFAANLDAILLLVAVEPPFSEAQLTRALIAAESAGVPAWIGLNKTDLPGVEATRERLAPYQAMGVPVVEFALKARPDEARERLSAQLAGRTTLVMGPSGMGKSTLINRFVPQAAALEGEISRALNTGRHTTTTTTWYALGEGAGSGALIDSPGFQAFGLHHIAATDLAALMPDLRAHREGCRFYNCTHRNEPGCQVRAAVEQGLVSERRWRLYVELFDELSASRY